MKEYDDATYGRRIAAVYDDLYTDVDPAAIDLLAELARGGPALELGIGTGRVALPLQAQGIALQGIDASEAMLARLRAKEGGAAIEVLTGSFANFALEQQFRLVYVVANTFFALLTQKEQVQCFQSAGRCLTPNGLFLIEAFVPDLCRFVDHQSMRAVNLTGHEVQYDLSQHDPVAQQVTSQLVFLSEEGTRLYPVKLRYAWPAELDLMAQIAGLCLRQRWGSWSQDPFTRDSHKHISIYGRAN